jgi:hypothetical protein
VDARISQRTAPLASRVDRLLATGPCVCSVLANITLQPGNEGRKVDAGDEDELAWGVFVTRAHDAYHIGYFVARTAEPVTKTNSHAATVLAPRTAQTVHLKEVSGALDTPKDLLRAIAPLHSVSNMLITSACAQNSTPAFKGGAT